MTATMERGRGALVLLISLGAFAGCEDGTPPDPPADGGCPAPRESPTIFEPLGPAEDRTLRADESPHLIAEDAIVYEGTTLTIEPCSEVRLAAGVSVRVRGALVAAGRPDGSVRIAAADAEPWSAVQAEEGGSLWLVDTVVEGGGATPPMEDAIDRGAVMVAGHPEGPTQEVFHAVRLSVLGSSANGIVLDARAGFSADSTEVTVEGAAGHPLRVWATELGTLPSGRYTGNGEDTILVPGLAGSETIATSMTVRDLRVPYRVGLPGRAGVLTVDAGADGMATLTIEAGVTIQLGGQHGVVQIDRQGSDEPAHGQIVAVGTDERPVVFTSASPSPARGDWLGLYFGSAREAGNRLEHVRIEFAGASGGLVWDCGSDELGGAQDRAAALMLLGAPPEASFLTASTIAHSALHGVDRGNPPTAVDFVSGNQLEDIAGCPQTGGSCGYCP